MMSFFLVVRPPVSHSTCLSFIPLRLSGGSSCYFCGLLWWLGWSVRIEKVVWKLKCLANCLEPPIFDGREPARCPCSHCFGDRKGTPCLLLLHYLSLISVWVEFQLWHKVDNREVLKEASSGIPLVWRLFRAVIGLIVSRVPPTMCCKTQNKLVSTSLMWDDPL